ncbi:MAG: hypothetical protein AB7K09_03765 [Planctomycetota bacterium]
MPENFYATLLGIDDEILQPDYYQLLAIDVNTDQLTPELVEEKYKAQMAKAQKVRTPKYKDLIEFLKGELRNAKRTLESPEQIKKYNLERGKEVAEKLRDMIDTFIQISGNLSEIEMHEIRHQAHILNCPKRMTEALIDEQLRLFGKQRSRATAEQMARASEIMQKRAQQRKAGSSDRLSLLGSSDGVTVPVVDIAPEDTRVRRMNEVAEEMQRSAARRSRYGPLFIVLKYVNLLLALVAWAAIAVSLLFVVAPGALEGTISGQFGNGGLHMFYGKNPELDAKIAASQQDHDTLTAQLKTANDTIASLRQDRAAARTWATEVQRDVDFSSAEPVDSLRRRLTSIEEKAAAMVDTLRDAGDEPDAVARLQQLVGKGQLDTARSVAADLIGDTAASTPLSEYARNTLLPAVLAAQPATDWTWAFATGRPLDFRHEYFSKTADGLLVNVPASAAGPLVWAFGASLEAGVVELEGSWPDGPGRFELELWHRDGQDVAGRVVFNAANSELALDVSNRNHKAQFSGTPESGDFRLRVQIAKETDLEISRLTAKVKAEYEQAGLRPASGSAIRASAGATDASTLSSNGRLAFHFPPGCKLLLKSITVK